MNAILIAYCSTKSSIIIWKNYIEFELMQKNIEKAKALFYRSLRDCPWSKGKVHEIHMK